MTQPEKVEVAGDWGGNDESIRVYQLDSEPSAEWWEWFDFHARSRLREIRPPLRAELARGSNSIEITRVLAEEVEATNEMVHSLVSVTNDRMIREARRAGEQAGMP